MIYADNAATTKLSGAAISAMLDCMEETWGNPSSLYGLGQQAKEALERARERLAACIGASPREITFTSGAARRIIRRSVLPPCWGLTKENATLFPLPLSTTLFSTR